MAYLFDTNHCIYLMNGWNTPEENRSLEERHTVESFQNIRNDVVYMSEASVGELWYGIGRSQRKASNQTRLNVLLSARASYSDSTRRVGTLRAHKSRIE